MEGKTLKEIETPQLTSANLYFTGKTERRGELATGIGRRAYAVAIENDKIQHRTVIHFVQNSYAESPCAHNLCILNLIKSVVE